MPTLNCIKDSYGNVYVPYNKKVYVSIGIISGLTVPAKSAESFIENGGKSSPYVTHVEYIRQFQLKEDDPKFGIKGEIFTFSDHYKMYMNDSGNFSLNWKVSDFEDNSDKFKEVI